MNTRQNFKLAVSVVETNRKTQSEYAVLSDLSDLYSLSLSFAVPEHYLIADMSCAVRIWLY